MFKLNFFRSQEVIREEQREAGYKDAAATLLHTGNQHTVEAMAMGFDSYAHGARDALYDYRRRRLEAIVECREFFTELELS